MKSIIPMRQMFLQFPPTIFTDQPAPTPRVWVKIADCIGTPDLPISRFVDNKSLVKLAIGLIREFPSQDTWHITDDYYGKQVREGRFVPIDDLREVEGICLEQGCEMPEDFFSF